MLAADSATDLLRALPAEDALLRVSDLAADDGSHRDTGPCLLGNESRPTKSYSHEPEQTTPFERRCRSQACELPRPSVSSRSMLRISTGSRKIVPQFLGEIK